MENDLKGNENCFESTGSRLYVSGPGLLTLYVMKFADLIKIQ